MLRRKPHLRIPASLVLACLGVLILLASPGAHRDPRATDMVPHSGKTRLFQNGALKAVDSATEPSLQTRLFHTLSGCCGLSDREILALCWDDVDFVNNTIAITKTSVSFGERVLTLPKPQNHHKIVPVPRSVAQHLKLEKTRQKRGSLITAPETRNSSKNG